jgi:predicted enzyme related to lactoylglutathione lyase
MPSAVTYFEISGPDASGLRSFYRSVLGLAVEEPDETGYAMVAPRESAIPGGIWDASTTWSEPDASYAVPYLEVDDVSATVEAAQAAGAKLVVAPRQHGPTISAHLLDPAGNRVGVFQMTQPAP